MLDLFFSKTQRSFGSRNRFLFHSRRSLITADLMSVIYLYLPGLSRNDAGKTVVSFEIEKRPARQVREMYQRYPPKRRLRFS